MMRLPAPLLLCLAFSPSYLAGQVDQSAADTVQAASSTIYLQSTLLGGSKYVADGEYYAAGGSFGKLRDHLVGVPEAYKLATEGSRIVTYGRITSLLGAAMGASTFLLHGELLEYGLSIGGFVVAGVGGAIQAQGRNRINEAVWLYNEAQRKRQTN